MELKSPVAIPETIQRQLGSFLQPDLVQEILQIGRPMKIREGDTIIDFGHYVKEIPFVIDGSLKIIREDSEGNEILLYYLQGGEACAMSMTCCFQHKKSDVKAVAEENTMIWMVPVNYMDEWIRKYYSWREFVFRSYSERFEEILNALDTIAFLKLDERLEKYLKDKQKTTGASIFYQTHQEIAQDLNTSRVVISRLLKQLENKGSIKLSRNKIKLLD